MRRGHAQPHARTGLAACLSLVVTGVAAILWKAPALSQPVDCRALAARIATLGESSPKNMNSYAGAIQRQRGELDRAIRSARALGCDRPHFFLFDNSPPQCAGLNAQIQQLQGSIAQMQAASSTPGNDANRQQLIASYNAYCRGQAHPAGQPHERGFFESLFGALNIPMPTGQQFLPSGLSAPAEQILPQPGEDLSPRGGSQALCVRSCDGGFFPLSVPASQSNPDELTNLCQALCPNAEVSVYTRSPFQDITTAVSLDDNTPYTEHPNALKYQKTFDSACTCKPPGKSWAEALAGAEQLLGHVRKSDLVVTPETSAALARPKSEKALPPRSEAPATAAAGQGDNSGANAQGQTEEVIGPDGVKRRVRIIVPPL